MMPAQGILAALIAVQPALAVFDTLGPYDAEFIGAADGLIKTKSERDTPVTSAAWTVHAWVTAGQNRPRARFARPAGRCSTSSARVS